MRLHRLRIEFGDVPGGLGEVAAALGRIGVDILDLDVHGDPRTAPIDEVVVDLTLPLDLPAVDHAVRGAGGTLLAIERIEPHDLRDGVTSALELAAASLEVRASDVRPVADAGQP